MFSSDQFDFEDASSKSYCSSNAFDSQEGSSNSSKQPHFQNLAEYLELFPLPFPYSQEVLLVGPQNSKPQLSTSASLGILNKFSTRFTQLKGNKVALRCKTAEVYGRKLSSNEIIRLAAEKFIQSSNILCHPFASSFLGLSNHETRNVELVSYLLASAEKVRQQHFFSATKFLNQCDKSSSNKGNPIQRLVHYFSLALRQRIYVEIGKFTCKIPGRYNYQSPLLDLNEELMIASSSIIWFHQNLPFSSIIQFSAMQAILENVIAAKKVHIVDLEIRNGMQYTVLMQALSARCECPVEYFRITAIGTKSRETIEETGQRLVSFAKSINLAFYFNVIMVADILDLTEDLIEVETEEAVAFYFPYVLSSMIVQPDRIESLMNMVKNMNPSVVVLFEIEANHNSPTFVSRFVEALFYYGALFDSLEDSMDCNEGNRSYMESKYFSPVIENIVSAEGGERIKRHISVDVWRSFFSRFGMVNTKMSVSLLYQASLVVNKFDCGGYCTIDDNGNCLIVRWKGTSIFSLSVWKFC